MGAVKFTETYMSFSGADALVSFDGKINHLVSGIEWKKPLSVYEGTSMRGTITCTCFEREPLEELEGKTFDILIEYLNECGQAKLEFFKDARLTSMASGVHVDKMYQEAVYEFAAKDMKTVTVGSESFEDRFTFVFDNEKSENKDLRLKAEAYKASLKAGFGDRYKIISSGEYSRLKNTEK